MAEFCMPSLGADMEAGTLIAWHKHPGERVKRGDIIAEVETEKGIIEVEVFSTGVIERLVVEPGAKVPVGTVMAILKDEVVSDVALPVSAVIAGPVAVESVSASTTAAPPAALSSEAATVDHLVHRKASPAARRRARELGVALEALSGSGPHGSVTVEDIDRAAQVAQAATGAPIVTAPSADARQQQQLKMRQAIAAAMSRSKREIPHYYAATTVDLSALLEWLERRNAGVPPPERLIAGVMFLKAVALALRDFPELNGRWGNGVAVPSSGIHVATAISLRSGGLVAPALVETDKSPLPELMQRFRDLVGRARAGTLRSSEFSMGTITVTSLGDRGTDTVYGVIYPPQVAIVGFGKIVERPWVVAGSVVPRRLVNITLAADHRVSDGHRGALFLDTLDRLLQAPEAL